MDSLIKYLLLCSLNENSLGLYFFNKLLCALSKHSRLIHSTNKIDLLAIESLCQMHKCSFKAVLSNLRFI